ncbi:MAG: ribosomal protein methyltransferase [Actinomycetota bacterium]|jgi:ribosomal protein L11 methyltransferase
MGGTAGGSYHLLLVVSVPIESAEFAADLLWSAGAQAVEEMHPVEGAKPGATVDLRTDLGSEPLVAWATIVEANPAAREWSVREQAVDARVADTWRQHATVTVVDGVSIVPAWLENACDSTSGNAVLIEPGGSFGIGDHPTTRATIALALRCPGSQVLDLGCGSGVLGITLAITRRARVVAVDVAPAAIEATRHNADINGVSDLIVIEQGDVRCVRGTYDLVLANILAPVLLSDADDIAARVAARGTLIVSGFNEARRSDIVARYSTLGLVPRETTEVEGWLALQFERR